MGQIAAVFFTAAAFSPGLLLYFSAPSMFTSLPGSAGEKQIKILLTKCFYPYN